LGRQVEVDSRGLALLGRTTIVASAMDPALEPGLVTLAKIIGTLLLGIGVVPLIFLFAPGDSTEPADRLDSEQK
jgi:hypothetical protein